MKMVQASERPFRGAARISTPQAAAFSASTPATIRTPTIQDAPAPDSRVANIEIVMDCLKRAGNEEVMQTPPSVESQDPVSRAACSTPRQCENPSTEATNHEVERELGA